jgi:hypothetical protein
VARVTEPGTLARIRSRPGGKLWSEMTEAEHRRFPGDWEAQVGQGPITYHSEEHLARSDDGIRLLRRRLEGQLAVVADGGDPVGTARTADEAWLRSSAGNFFA